MAGRVRANPRSQLSRDQPADEDNKVACRQCKIEEPAVDSEGEVLTRCVKCLVCDVCAAPVAPDDCYLDTGIDVVCPSCFCLDCRRPFRRFGLTVIEGMKTEICNCRKPAKSLSHRDSLQEDSILAYDGEAGITFTRLFFSFYVCACIS